MPEQESLDNILGLLDTHYFNSPIGYLELKASNTGIQRIRFLDAAPEAAALPNVATANPHLQLLTQELESYFAGENSGFSCHLDTKGTGFQNRVWGALKDVPYGQIRTYGQIAEAIGSPKASRAVGGANNRNPVPIVVPCHRILGTNQKLIGFAAGLERKRWLLEHEGVELPLERTAAKR